MDALTLDGVPADDLAARWGAPAVWYARSLPSALDALHERAAAGAPAGTIVVCDEQTAGRGRDGRRWHSPPGGVWLAFLLRPPVATPGAIALRAGLAVADVVDAVAGAERAALKWPNDVQVDGRKLAGVLCESRWSGDRLQWMGVGIGINVENSVPEPVAATAVALRELVPRIRRLDVLDRLAPALARLDAGGAPLSERERAAFTARHGLHGRALRAPVAGRVAGIEPDGALVVETPSGRVSVRDGHPEPV